MSRTVLLSIVGAFGIALALLGAVAVGNWLAYSGTAMQYPPGQRPCSEALDALHAVTMAQLNAGPGSTDPDGEVRDALEDAKEALSYRAGESDYYSAIAYDMAADAVLATIDPLIDAYDREDPDTPYTEATDYIFLHGDYSDARAGLGGECSS
ncbi:MAG: hypothetical protein GEV09_01375 [Pseudonocardiaceae bacterium]|nr:hypothetical protein [Pseudonocardiaceae bacterium]